MEGAHVTNTPLVSRVRVNGRLEQYMNVAPKNLFDSSGLGRFRADNIPPARVDSLAQPESRRAYKWEIVTPLQPE
jgi:hypothetical protein